MRHFSSYEELTKTPQAHLEFLEFVDNEIEKPSSQDLLGFRLADLISIKGKPFSQSRHLISLEHESYEWDWDACTIDEKVRIVALSQVVARNDKGYNLQHFTNRYKDVLKEVRQLYGEDNIEAISETPCVSG